MLALLSLLRPAKVAMEPEPGALPEATNQSATDASLADAKSLTQPVPCGALLSRIYRQGPWVGWFPCGAGSGGRRPQRAAGPDLQIGREQPAPLWLLASLQPCLCPQVKSRGRSRSRSWRQRQLALLRAAAAAGAACLRGSGSSKRGGHPALRTPWSLQKEKVLAPQTAAQTAQVQEKEINFSFCARETLGSAFFAVSDRYFNPRPLIPIVGQGPRSPFQGCRKSCLSQQYGRASGRTLG